MAPRKTRKRTLRGTSPIEDLTNPSDRPVIIGPDFGAWHANDTVREKLRELYPKLYSLRRYFGVPIPVNSIGRFRTLKFEEERRAMVEEKYHSPESSAAMPWGSNYARRGLESIVKADRVRLMGFQPTFSDVVTAIISNQVGNRDFREYFYHQLGIVSSWFHLGHPSNMIALRPDLRFLFIKAQTWITIPSTADLRIFVKYVRADNKARELAYRTQTGTAKKFKQRDFSPAGRPLALEREFVRTPPRRRPWELDYQTIALRVYKHENLIVWLPSTEGPETLNAYIACPDGRFCSYTPQTGKIDYNTTMPLHGWGTTREKVSEFPNSLLICCDAAMKVLYRNDCEASVMDQCAHPDVKEALDLLLELVELLLWLPEDITPESFFRKTFDIPFRDVPKWKEETFAASGTFENANGVDKAVQTSEVDVKPTFV